MNTFEHTLTIEHSRDKLLERIAHGVQFEYFLFYDNGQNFPQTYLSPWFPTQFEVDGVTYKTSEHFMMAEKARLSNDFENHHKILECSTPREAKRLGREVHNFDSDFWKRKRMKVVIRGSLHKFEQNPELKKLLISTSPSVLVEASPTDSIWGIGMGPDDPDAFDPEKWRGENLLGFALTEVRDKFIRESWRKIINKCDPVYFIDAGAPEDEYDYETSEISKVALSCNSIEELASLIRQKFVFVYKEMVRSENERFALAAEELWALLHA